MVYLIVCGYVVMFFNYKRKGNANLEDDTRCDIHSNSDI